MTQEKFRCTGVLLLVASLQATSAQAGYGTLAVGYGFESLAMAGADMGNSSDASAFNNNPAGMARLKANLGQWTVEHAPLGSVRHEDSLGNDAGAEGEFVSASAGMVWQSKRWDSVRYGLGFVGQGGVGFEYLDLQTEYGNRDDINALFGVFRLAPSVAWQVTPGLRLGLAASINYSEADQEIFPETSNAADNFAGVELTGLSGISYAARIGVQYDVSPRLTLGAAYETETDIVIENGKAVVNFSDFGLGKVTYRDADIEGFKLPQQFSVGLAWRPESRLLVALDANWYGYRDAMKKVTTTFSRPNNPGAPAQIVQSGEQGGNNIWALCLGIRYQHSDQVRWYAGYNYVELYQDKAFVTPVNNLNARDHMTLALEYMGTDWRLGISLLKGLYYRSEYEPTTLPLGDSATETFDVTQVQIGYSKKW